MIPFMNDTQSVEGQPRFDVLDVFRVRRDESGQAAGRDDGRLTSSSRMRSIMPSTWAAKP